MASTCLPDHDRSFGPRVDPTCRAFDFTLLFEDIFLASLPAAVFLTLVPLHVIALFRRSIVCSAWSKVLLGKLVSLVGLFVTQIAVLALRAQRTNLQTNASLAADLLLLLASIGAVLVSFLDHQRSLRPSTILSLYLSVLIIVNVARARTLWLIGTDNSMPVVMTVNLTFLIISLAAESVERQSSLKSRKRVGAPEQYSGFWNRASFMWLAATFRAGYSKIISIEDVPRLDTQLASHVLGRELRSTWAKYNPRHRHTLLRACFSAFLPSLLSAVIPRICVTVFTFTQAFLIDATVTFTDEREAEISYGRGLIGAWGLTMLGLGVSTAVYRYQALRTVTRFRGGLLALIYEHSVRTRSVDSGRITAVSLVGTDVERIAQHGAMFHEAWACLIDIPVGIWLLERQMSVACVAPVALILLFILSMYCTTSATRRSQRLWIEKVQERLRLTSSMLNDMKMVKMLGLSQIMSSVIQGSRIREIETSRVYRKLMVLNLLLSNTPMNLAPVVSFAVYIIIAIYWQNTSLLTAQAFTSVALVSMLTTPALVFIQTMPALIQCIGSFDRIQEFCNYTLDKEAGFEEGEENNVQIGNGSAISLKLLPAMAGGGLAEKGAFTIDGQSFGWSDSKPMFLKDVKVHVEFGKITAVVGPVGSGKTTFLESILGETFSATGVAKRALPPTAYCAQEAWLENGSIRESIIGISPYDRQWFGVVKSACGLLPDLEDLERGDQTKIGSKGLNLSGGQKQRIALARAVYARSAVVILDDVFSGMDAHTVEHVSRALFGSNGLFKRQSTTVILATHSHKLMAMADTIVAFEDGRIVETGSPSVLLGTNGYVSRLNLKVASSDATDTGPIEAARDQKDDESRVSTDMADEVETLSEDLRRKRGDFSVYGYYFSSSGYATVTLLFASIGLWVFCTEFPTIWLKWWAEANTKRPNADVGMYMGIYAMFGFIGIVLVSAACWVAFISIISKSAYKLHLDLLETTLRAPLRFFSATDTGTLTNRFSQDMELIDMNLPLVMVNYISAVFFTFAKAIIIVIFSQYMAVTVPFVGTLVFFLQRYYLQTSRQVRLLEIEAKAPLFTHFIETVAGASTIRAFGWKSQYEERSYCHIDTSQRPAYLQYCIQQWLSFVLSVIVAVLAMILVATVVTWKDKFSAGSVGVSLVMVLTFSMSLARLIMMWTMMESSVGAVARVKNFVAETESEETDGPHAEIPALWPRQGAIQFEGLVASHRPESEPILEGISFSVKPQHHVAICGRSGSGKSSLVLCLLQMIEIQQGRITVDGIDLATLRRHQVRLHINVVPQDPFLIPGTVRFNIDPFGTATDGEIMSALGRVRLWDIIVEQGGLDQELDAAAWSVGQKQLLCLARAMVRKCRVLILDEAASSVDSDTEAVMQDIIDTEFKHCTVIAVMHRLKHVVKYDMVALLDRGKLTEYDTPAGLLAIESRFAALSKSSAR